MTSLKKYTWKRLYGGFYTTIAVAVASSEEQAIQKILLQFRENQNKGVAKLSPYQPIFHNGIWTWGMIYSNNFIEDYEPCFEKELRLRKPLIGDLTDPVD